MSAASAASAAGSGPASGPVDPAEAGWSSLKARGNQHFKLKQYAQAQEAYQQAIEALRRENEAATAPSASASGSDSAASASQTQRRSDLGVLYSNLSATLFQLADYAGALRAADAALAADPSFLKARLRRALALERLAQTRDSASAATAAEDEYRRVTQLQEAVGICTKLAQILRSNANAGGAGTAAPTGLPSLVEVDAALQRLRAALSSLHSRAASPIPFLEALRAATGMTNSGGSHGNTSASAADGAAQALKPRGALRGLMRLVSTSGAAKAEALREGLVECLLRLCMQEPAGAGASSGSFLRTRAAAVRALRYLLSADMAAGGGSQSPGADTSASASASASTGALDLQPVRAAAPKILDMFESMCAQQSNQGKQVPPPLPPYTSALGEALRALCGLLSRLAAHPRLEHAYTSAVCSALQRVLPRYTTHSPAALSVLWGSTNSAAHAHTVRLCIAAVEAVTYVASSPFVPAPVLKQIRTDWLPLLLLEPSAQLAHEQGSVQAAAGCAQLRSAILAGVAVLTKNAMPRGGAGAAAAAAANSMLHSLAPSLAKTFGGGMMGSRKNDAGEEMGEEQQKELEAEGIAIREQVLRMLYAPLMGTVQPLAPPSSDSAPSAPVPVRLNFVEATRLVRGLSLLLQANSLLGIFLVSFGATKETAPQPQQQQQASSRVQEEQKRKEEDENSDDVPSANTAAAAAPETAPTILQLLLSLSSYVSQPLLPVSSGAPGAPPKLLQLLCAEVLALASSDSLIRHTLVQLSRSSDEDEEGDEELRAEGVLDGNAAPGRGADVFMDLIVQYTDRSLLDPSPSASAAPPSSQKKQTQQPQSSSTTTTSTSAALAAAASTRDPHAPTPNETIVAHACLALSKLVAVGEWGTVPAPPALAAARTAAAATGEEEDEVADAEGGDEFAVLLHILVRLIEKHQGAVPRVEKESEREARLLAKRARQAQVLAARKAKAKEKALATGSGLVDDEEDEDEEVLEDDDEDGGESFLAESQRLQQVSLLHLCFESLSYLSLHVFAKKWLALDSDGHGLRVLVGIAAGTPVSSSTSSSSTVGSSPPTLGVLSDSTLRYALLHIFRNLCTSRVSLSSSHNAEVEALKKMASKGLGESRTSAAINEEQNERQQRLAGSAHLVHVVMRVFTQWKGVAALVQLHRAFVVQQQEMDSNLADKRVGSAPASASAGGASAASSSVVGAGAAGAAPVLLTPSLSNAFAFALLQLSSVTENRGLMVQQGAVRLLLDLYAQSTKPSDDPHGASAASDENASHNSPTSPFRCAFDSLSALARIFISTNPALVGDSHLPAVALALLEALSVAEHELLIFESLMALTNIASTPSPGHGAMDLAEFVCAGAAQQRGGNRAKHQTKAGGASTSPSSPSSSSASSSLNGWYLAKSHLASSNPLVQRAAVELLTNLVNCEWARRRLRAVPAELEAARGEKVTQRQHDESVAAQMEAPGREQSEDLRLLLAFALSDDVATARAATGALAMLASDPLIGARIAHTTVTSFVALDGDRTEGKDDSVVETGEAARQAQAQAPPNTRALVRTGRTICNKLMRDPDTHPDVKLRVQHILNSIQ